MTKTNRARRAAMAIFLLATLAAGAIPVSAVKIKDLPERYQKWLDEVWLIMHKKERKEFLKLEKDYQRDGFIRKFWAARDPDPETPDNRYKSFHLARLEEARERYRFSHDDRFPVYVLNGDPSSITEIECRELLWPIEVWHYSYSPHTRGELKLILYQRGTAAPYRLWFPNEPYDTLIRFVTEKPFLDLLVDECALTPDHARQLLALFQVYKFQGPTAITRAIGPPNLDPEWLSTFRAHSTELFEGTEQFEPRLAIDYPGPHKQRVIVRAVVHVPRDAAEVVDLNGRRSYNFSLNGEVLKDDELFESFKYVFDVPEDELETGEVPMVFERWLRPGDYRLVVKLEDVHGGAAGRAQQEITVPALTGRSGIPMSDLTGDAEPEPPAPEVPASLDLVAEGKDLQRGYARFSANVEGTGIAKVRFFLEDRPILTKTRPPFSVELDLGRMPETMTVRAVALDAAGRELATDEVLLNPGEYGFAVNLIEPQWGGRHTGSVRARAEIERPEESELDRVEFYRDDTKVATLFQEPFAATIPLPHDELTVIRVVALLSDGNQTEDLAILNGADYLETLDVRMIEVFASVLDENGAPVTDLGREDFEILEDGDSQEILRFEHLQNLPIFAGLLIDTSASMAERMEAVRDAAARFFEQALRPKDRAAVVTFADRPRLVTGFTADLDELTGALAGIKAGEGTALYDSILFALYNFRGLKGQRALLILSDGEDRRSKATFDEAREFALGSGVTLYTIGVEKGMSRRGKVELTRLAEETGGRAFLIKSVDELDAIYDTIQRDLRSKFFLAYQPAPSDDRAFRVVEVQVARPGSEVRAMRGYVPR